VELRKAEPRDAAAMAKLINEIIDIGGTTAHRRHFDSVRVVAEFIAPPLGISCFVAFEAELLGFQVLEWADPKWQGEGKLPPDWAVIASFVSPAAQGQGVGQALFTHTLNVAKKSGAVAIDAKIRKENAIGLAYYSRIGFQDYAEGDLTVSKCYRLDA